MTIQSDVETVATVVDIRTWIDHPSWMADAACRGVATSLFYPERGETAPVAKRVCRECPVRAECLDYAMLNNETWGVWGGTSERQRRRLRRRLQTARYPFREPPR